MELDLSWLLNCVISEISKTAAVVANPNSNSPVKAGEATLITRATFQTKLIMSQLSFCL